MGKDRSDQLHNRKKRNEKHLTKDKTIIRIEEKDELLKHISVEFYFRESIFVQLMTKVGTKNEEV